MSWVVSAKPLKEREREIASERHKGTGQQTREFVYLIAVETEAITPKVFSFDRFTVITF